MSDSEESSAMKDCDQQSMGDTDNQVCKFFYIRIKLYH